MTTQHSPGPDLFDDPALQAWSRETVSMLAASAVSLAVYSGQVDGKLALELGASVLLDKPIIMVVASGSKVPEKVVRVADRIIEADMDDPAGAAERIRAALSTFGVIS